MKPKIKIRDENVQFIRSVNFYKTGKIFVFEVHFDYETHRQLGNAGVGYGFGGGDPPTYTAYWKSVDDEDRTFGLDIVGLPAGLFITQDLMPRDDMALLFLHPMTVKREMLFERKE